jgi:hypothetical protein
MARLPEIAKQLDTALAQIKSWRRRSTPPTAAIRDSAATSTACCRSSTTRCGRSAPWPTCCRAIPRR